ncbi:MAG: Uma2 family endonuclease [Cyanobacteria bacterium P01_A01_bin.114]
MVATPLSEITNDAAIVYPSSDGEPLAETSVHVDAIINIVVILRQLLQDQQAIVLADQFLYYAQGWPRLRVAPDVMVIENVEPGPRDNYKIWEEGAVPSVVFEVTSEGTQGKDREFKKTLYEQLGIPEYWLFDPKGEWIPEKLQGYQLHKDEYEPITNSKSQALGLRLAVEDKLIGFYRLDTDEKLLAADELVVALQTESKARQLAEDKAERLAQRLREMGVDPSEV